MTKKVVYSVLIIVGIMFFAGYGQNDLAPKKNVPSIAAQESGSTSISTAKTQNVSAVKTSPIASNCGQDYYKNVDGTCVHSPSSSPQGATAICGDGTYSYSLHRQGTCSHHRGVDEWL